VYLRCADGCAIVLGNLHPALRGFVRLCFSSTICYVVHFFYYSMLKLIIQLLWVILSCVVFWLANYSHETPLSGARLLKGLATELCGPSDRHLEALPMRYATQGHNTNE